jgi:hypothetical protein
LIMRHKTPSDYEQKFAGLIKLCDETKASGVKRVVIAAPWVLGDTYDEVMESLIRISKASLDLHIAEP